MVWHEDVPGDERIPAFLAWIDITEAEASEEKLIKVAVIFSNKGNLLTVGVFSYLSCGRSITNDVGAAKNYLACIHSVCLCFSPVFIMYWLHGH